jgi:3-deoxy-7-phosphoheptulonate synthase
MTHLPVIFDPSHATGKRDLVLPTALASIVVGAHGVMVEVHPDPEHALSDGAQSLHFKEFDSLLAQMKSLISFKKQKLTVQ